MRAKWIIKPLQKIFGTLKNGSLGSLNTTVTDLQYSMRNEDAVYGIKVLRFFILALMIHFVWAS